MNGAVTLTLVTIVAWATYIVFYVRYAVAYHPRLRTRKFILGHCLLASVVFGAFYALGMWLATSATLHDMFTAAGAAALLYGLTYVVARDFFRPLMSPMNALLPPACTVTTITVLFFFVYT